MQNDLTEQINAWLRQAGEAQTTSDYATAVAAARQAITLAQDGGLRELEARGAYEWSRALLFMGQLPEAYAQFENTLALARSAGL